MDRPTLEAARLALGTGDQLTDGLRVGWLECLANSYDAEHDWVGDVDPLSILEMLREVRALVARLKAVFPEPTADVMTAIAATRLNEAEIPY